MRIAVGKFLAKSAEGEKFLAFCKSGFFFQTVVQQAFHNAIPKGQAGVKALNRALEHHLHFLVSFLEFRPFCMGNVFTIQINPSAAGFQQSGD